jgi:subtilisin family serine protease
MGLARRLQTAAKLFSAIVVAAGAAVSGCAVGPVQTPRLDSLEYQRSWGLDAIGAEAAYAAGYTGRGVRIGLIDCGVARGESDLGRNLSRESADLVPVRAARLTDPHGNWVAEPLGSALDGQGTVGVAYNATLLEIRADMDGGYKGECAFWPLDLARALDYAVRHKARIVTLPVQAPKPLGPDFEAALARAAEAGVVVVIAAGNDSASEPAWPARYAVDPRFSRIVVVAGASTLTGEIATWSNRAGAASARYVLAPGEWILTDCRAHCQLATGTSFAAPFVAGAIALMMEAHPELSGPEAVDRVLAAARPLDQGGEAIWGRGMLDLSRAFPAPPVRAAARK